MHYKIPERLRLYIAIAIVIGSAWIAGFSFKLFPWDNIVRWWYMPHLLTIGLLWLAIYWALINFIAPEK